MPNREQIASSGECQIAVLFGPQYTFRLDYHYVTDRQARMEHMRASVIIPVYNSSRYLEECLGSVLCQSEKDIEVICVDDGSTDDSRRIIVETANRDPRVKLLVQDNMGGGAARNAGIDIACGEYLYFMDSDDRIGSDLIEVAAEVCDLHDADIAVFPAYTFDDATGESWDTDWVFRRSNIPQRKPFNYRDMPDFVFNTFGNVPWNKVFRRSFVEKHSLRFQEIRRTNDLLFVCSALVHAEKIATIDKHLAYYRVGHGSNCQSTNEIEPLGFYKALRALEEVLRSKGLLSELRKSYINHALDAIVSNLSTQKTPEGFGCLLHSFKTDMEGHYRFESEGKDYYYDPSKYELFLALHDSEEKDCIFSWARVMQAQRDEAWAGCRRADEEIRRRDASIEGLRSSLADFSLELSDIRSSVSYRAGRAMTYPFRKVRDVARGESRL